jgi:hypothetical protein
LPRIRRLPRVRKAAHQLAAYLPNPSHA